MSDRGPIQQALDALDTLADHIVADRAEVAHLVDNADSDGVVEAVIGLLGAYEAGHNLDEHIVALVSVVLGLPEVSDGK